MSTQKTKRLISKKVQKIQKNYPYLEIRIFENKHLKICIANPLNEKRTAVIVSKTPRTEHYQAIRVEQSFNQALAAII